MLLPPLLGFDVKIDRNFSLKEKEILIQCLMDWHKATHQLIIFRLISTEMNKITFETDYTINILKAHGKDKLVELVDKKYELPVLGFAFYSKKQLFAIPVIDRTKDSDTLHKVMLHEIGHCIAGWDHLDEPIGIMYSRLIESPITYADLVLLINNIRRLVLI
jgi:hypothetical protein